MPYRAEESVWIAGSVFLVLHGAPANLTLCCLRVGKSATRTDASKRRADEMSIARCQPQEDRGAVLSQLLDLAGECNRRQKRVIGRNRFWRFATCPRVNRMNQIETTRNCHRSSDDGGPLREKRPKSRRYRLCS